MENVSGVMKEISKSKVEPETPTKSKEKKDKKEKGAKIEPEPVKIIYIQSIILIWWSQPKSKVAKRKGPLDWLPTTYEEWSIFEVTDDVLEALTSTTHMPETGFNDTSIANMVVIVVVLSNEDMEIF